jgi:HAD superfamily hydrolase (TIGR01509 family)
VPLKALLWDVDGTLAETERDGHRPAFNQAFAEAGVPVCWSAQSYAPWLAISGGQERIAAQLRHLQGRDPEPDLVAALQRAKQQHYRALVQQGGLALRPGVQDLLHAAAEAGLVQVIVTTSARTAVSALLEQLLGPSQRPFAFWVCGDDVARKKPDPEAYVQAAQRLISSGRVASTAEMLVIEDSRQGLLAAAAAGLRCLVSLSHYGAEAVLADPAAASAVVSQLGRDGAVLHGPPCQRAGLTLSYLQALVP